MEKPTDIILGKQIKEKEKYKLLGIQSKYNHTQEVKVYKRIPYKNSMVKKIKWGKNYVNNFESLDQMDNFLLKINFPNWL